jgi:hypothetical protein
MLRLLKRYPYCQFILHPWEGYPLFHFAQRLPLPGHRSWLVTLAGHLAEWPVFHWKPLT